MASYEKDSQGESKAAISLALGGTAITHEAALKSSAA